MKIKDIYWGSNIAIFLGALSMVGITDNLLIKFGGYGYWGAGSHFNPGGTPGMQYGFLIILGALTYKAAKKRKFQSSKVWLGVEIVTILLFLYQFIPFKTGGYVAPTYEYVEQLNWPFSNVWFFATETNITPEYKVPAIITLIVWMWTIAVYSYIKSRKSSETKNSNNQ